MGRRGDLHDHARLRDFMKAVKAEAVYLRTFDDVNAALSSFID
jgi:hypothetical protein